MPTSENRSFSGGEISPSLYARTDTEKYQTGLATCRNFIVGRHGGITRRPGTEYVGRIKYGRGPVRLIPYIYGEGDTYVLEFGTFYVRPIKEGSYIYKTPSHSISDISASGIVTLTRAVNVAVNDPVRISGVQGIQNVNNVEFVISSSISPTKYKLKKYGASADWTPTGSYVSGGTLRRIVEVQTPYKSSELFQVRLAQNDRSLLLTHPSHEPRVLSVKNGVGGRQWDIQYAREQDALKVLSPTDQTTTKAITTTGETTGNGFPKEDSAHSYGSIDVDAGDRYMRYAVTAVTDDGFESLPSFSKYLYQKDKDTTTYTRAVAINVSNSGSGTNLVPGGQGTLVVSYPDGIVQFDADTNGNLVGSAYRVKISARSGYQLSSDDAFTVEGTDFAGESIRETVSSAAALEVDTKNLTLVTENYFKSVERIVSRKNVDTPRLIVGLADWDMGRVKVSWPQPKRWIGRDGKNNTGKLTYRVYKSIGGLYGLIGETEDLFFNDYDIEPEYTAVPPTSYNPFPVVVGKRKTDFSYVPRACCYYQQRRIYAQSGQYPERIWASAIGQYNNFDDRKVITDSDSFSWDVAGTRINRILHLLPLGRLLVFTASGEWLVHGDDAGGITPTVINMQQLSHYGSGDLPPLPIGSNALFYQPRGSIIRDIGSQYQTSGYQGNDLTVFGGHLLQFYQIEDWDYQQGPESVVWCVRDDGTLLGMTYLPEHRIQGWHRHDFRDGTDIVESIAVIPEGEGSAQQDYVYLAMQRQLDGGPTRVIERMSRANFENYVDLNYVDSSALWDGWNSGDSRTMTVSDSGDGLTEGDTVQIESSDSIFAHNQTYYPLISGTSDQRIGVGDAIVFGSKDSGEVFRVTITSTSSATVALGELSADLPDGYEDSGVSNWGHAIGKIRDVPHLNDQDVSIYGDGAVLASPNNTDFTTRTISGGEVVVSPPSVVVRIGLPYTSDFKTLNIDYSGNPLVDLNKHVSRVNLHLRESRGGLVGPDEPAGYDAKDGLQPLEYDTMQEYSSTNEPYTGYNRVHIDAEWNRGGQVFVRQIDPLPFNVLAIYPQFDVSKRGNPRR